MRKLNYAALELVLISIILLFSACTTNERIPSPLNCPKLDIIELPSKINMKDTLVLGNANIYNDINRTYTDIYTHLINQDSFALINSIVMPMEMLVEIIDYVAELRTKIELYNNKVRALERDDE